MFYMVAVWSCHAILASPNNNNSFFNHVFLLKFLIVFLFNRLNNVFIIGKGSKAYISLPRDKGVKLSIAEERNKRLAAKAAA